MGFLEHLDELRKRIIRVCVAIGVGMLIAFIFIERIVNFILAPARRMLPPGSHFIFTQPGEAFSLYVTAALIAGMVLAAPVVMYQVWLFIAPGLYANEKKLAIPFVTLTTTGALLGAAFSHYVLFPATMAFFGTFSSADISFLPRIRDTFDLYLKMLAGMVLAFQIPTVVFFLAKMRLITAGFLWRNIKYAVLFIFVAFVAAAVLTPSADPWNQAIFAAPMLGLYLISIGIAWMVRPIREEQPAEHGTPHHLHLVLTSTLNKARQHRQHVRADAQPWWHWPF
jgi:sec-independent protein translocase protein TatC